MTTPAPTRSPGVSPITWAVWVLALLPLLNAAAIGVVDMDGYLRAVLEFGVQSVDDTTPTLPPGILTAFGTFAVGGMLGFVAQVGFVVLAAVDWVLLRRRGIDRPFHWAWSFFVLISLGGLVYLIGRTVVAQRRTGRGAAAPLVVSIVLAVGAVAVSIVKVVLAFAAVAPLMTSITSTVS